MFDLAASSVVILLASILLGVTGARIARRVSRRFADCIALCTAAFLVVFLWCWAGSVQLARAIPFSGALILADLLLPTTALLAGLAWHRLPGSAMRKSILIAPLLLLCLYRSFGWVTEPKVTLSERWKNGVCMQTSSASCSAAAAATLLHAHGINATESEMAELCLTRISGTPMLGLYRGLVLKTNGTPWRIEVFHVDTAALRRSDAPAILSVGLPRVGTANLDPRYEKQWGWVPGIRHTVVNFAFADGGRVEMGDPAVGREFWSANDLHVLWSGDGNRLVRR